MNVHNRRVVLAAGMIFILAAAGCTSTADPTPTPSEIASVVPTTAAASSSASPSSSAGAGEGEEVSVFDLEIGDCFRADADQVEFVTVVDCESPHIYEAFGIVDHEAGDDEPYPGDEAILDYADTQCQVGFEEFVGLDYQSSVWYITSVTPSEETWSQGDREIICTLNQQDDVGEPIEVSGSAEGSAE